MSFLRDLQRRIGEGNAARGFHERGDELRSIIRGTTRYEGKPPTEADKALVDYYTARLALITTEVAEAIEELRNGRAVDETHYPEPPSAATRSTKLARPPSPKAFPLRLPTW